MPHGMVLAIAAAAVIVAASAGVALYALQKTGTSETVSSAYTIISRNVTVHGRAAFYGICPPPLAIGGCVGDPNNSARSLTSVELIAYHGSSYYVHNITINYGGEITTTRTFGNGSISTSILSQAVSSRTWTF